MMSYRFQFVNEDGDANVVVVAIIGTISAWIATFVMWNNKKKGLKKRGRQHV